MKFDKITPVIGVFVVSMLALVGCGQSPSTNGTSTASNKTLNSQTNNNSVTNSSQSSPSKLWIQVTSPKSNQTIKAGSTLDITGQLSRVQREPNIQVTLYQSVSSNYKEKDVQLAQKNVPVTSNATFNGTLLIPHFDKSNGTHFTLTFKYKGVPQVFTLALHQ